MTSRWPECSHAYWRRLCRENRVHSAPTVGLGLALLEASLVVHLDPTVAEPRHWPQCRMAASSGRVGASLQARKPRSRPIRSSPKQCVSVDTGPRAPTSRPSKLSVAGSRFRRPVELASSSCVLCAESTTCRPPVGRHTNQSRGHWSGTLAKRAHRWPRGCGQRSQMAANWAI